MVWLHVKGNAHTSVMRVPGGMIVRVSGVTEALAFVRTSDEKRAEWLDENIVQELSEEKCPEPGCEAFLMLRWSGVACTICGYEECL